MTAEASLKLLCNSESYYYLRPSAVRMIAYGFAFIRCFVKSCTRMEFNWSVDQEATICVSCDSLAYCFGLHTLISDRALASYQTISSSSLTSSNENEV